MTLAKFTEVVVLASAESALVMAKTWMLWSRELNSMLVLSCL